MKLSVLVFTEGTTTMHSSAEKIRDYSSYIPVKNAVEKLKTWKEEGCEISYLTSRRIESEIAQVKEVLKKHGFPDGPLYNRNEGEEYKDVVERIKPDVLVEDDCASIGADEIIAPKLDPKLKIKTIVVKEFGGIDHLPTDPIELINYRSNLTQEANRREEKNWANNFGILFFASILGALASKVIDMIFGKPFLVNIYGILWLLSASLLLFVALNFIELFDINIPKKFQLPTYSPKTRKLLLFIGVIILIILIFVLPFLMI